MNKGIIKTKYFEVTSEKHIKDVINEMYCDGNFDEWYNSQPFKMTPQQIAVSGKDLMKSQLRSKYIETNHNELNAKIDKNHENVMVQLTDILAKRYDLIELGYSYTPVAYNKYTKKRTNVAYITLGHDNTEEYLEIRVYLKEDELLFSLKYDTNYLKGTRQVTDEELFIEIDKFVKYQETRKHPTELVRKVSHHVDNQYTLWYDKHEFNLYDVEMIMLYHTLAKFVNKKYGTDFPYSQEVIDRLYKHPVFGNIQHVGEFYLYEYFNHTELKYKYFYKDDYTKLPTFQCVSNYGDYTLDEIKVLLSILQPYATSDYFAETSQKYLSVKYNNYKKMHIGYNEYPSYFKDLKCKDCVYIK